VSTPFRATCAAFLIGLAAALAAELAAGLLLYATRGLLEAVTLVFGVGLGALGLGLAAAPARGRADQAGLLRRWFFALFAFGAAAVVSAAWSLREGVPDGALARGVSLALLEALPLYAVGALLGAISAATSGARVGAAAALGASLGVVLAGTVLLLRSEPVSIYLLGVVLLSGAALVHGRLPPTDGPPAATAEDEVGGPAPEDEVAREAEPAAQARHEAHANAGADAEGHGEDRAEAGADA
jgi:hypothetical protein